MPTLTRLTGYLYDAQGTPLVCGILTLKLQSDMISVDGTKVAPVSISVDLSEMSPAGLVDVSLYATQGATPAGLSYLMTFNPDPDNTSVPDMAKDGYFALYAEIPNQGQVSLGQYVSALRGQVAHNYVPLGGSVGKLEGTITLFSPSGSTGYLLITAVDPTSGLETPISIAVKTLGGGM